ncbi:MAG: elongation factor P [Firmicutes bacterium]|uniref:Elongation factor P n=1 Tax=Geochorda subterranea TaxID=3109564 RepID=A0ABZ1BLM0_9FIRM|nr:elongation factor P [Limnochorda sp. LNt]NLG69728.1 elongation factor P [Bacillota bacterium]WRP13470.1 elongation factor P [Limnochorda sp. LNt]
MISVNDLRPGLTIEVDGEVWSVVEFLHVKPGKGAAFVRTKLKNVKTGNVIERTFKAGERVNRAHVETREMQFLYHSGPEWHFMDTQTYEQVAIQEANLGDAPKYLKENDVILIQFYEGQPIGVELPTFVELKVVETEPGVRGDTAQGGSKPARVETGLVVQVPLFIEVGDVIRVDTRTGEYLSRA